MNLTKTVSTAFHLCNSQANRVLNIQVDDLMLPYDNNPKYLGIILDRSLTYKQHLEATAHKIGKRNSILKKITGTSWGAHQTVLRTTALALSYSVAEYCAPVWNRSLHVDKIDGKLSESMRNVAICLRSTSTKWLPCVMSNKIEPPHIRRENINQRWIQGIPEMETEIPLVHIVNSAPETHRLRSRRPFYKSKITGFNIKKPGERSGRQACHGVATWLRTPQKDCLASIQQAENTGPLQTE